MRQDAKAASRFRSLLASERRSADLYAGLAGAATGDRREVLSELSAVERKHAAHWAAKLHELGEPVPAPAAISRARNDHTTNDHTKKEIPQ